MLKLKSKQMPVIYLKIQPGDKQILQTQAENNGLSLTAYCRMILLNVAHKEVK